MSKGKQGAKSAKKDSARRFGAQDRQEAVSKGQFCVRLGQLGWNVLQPEKDLGEDYLVQIYDDGVSSGLSFYVQLKSFANAEKRKRKRSPGELRYPLFVKNIKDWEVQSPPVVLVVWDVEKQTGYWETIPRIIEALEKKGKAWREKKSVDVTVSSENATDDEGMGRLRYELAQFMLPLFNAHRSMTVKMTMSKATADELIAAWDRGGGMTLRDESLPKLEWPTWHSRLFGSREKTAEVQISPVKLSTVSIALRVEVRVGKAISAIPHVELRRVGAGIKKIYLSNEHQRHPLVFSVEGEIGANTLQFKFRRTQFGRSIQEAREITEFVCLANQPGGHIRVIEMNSGKIILEQPTYAPSAESMKILETRRNTMEKLVQIEPYLSRFGSVDLSHGLGEDDVETIEILYEAIKTGQVEFVESFELEISPDWPLLPALGDKPVTKEEIFSPSLLGLKMNFEAIDTIVDSRGFIAKIRACYEEARKMQRSVRAEFKDLLIIRKLRDLILPDDRLREVAITQSGYFTITQALEAGFTSAAQLEIHERVERCAEGVYRFILHPPSEHEDLVVTWLQTEKHGVFSHDTALALHELSDILPVRQHVTVPQGWKPIEGMALSPNTVVHYGAITDEEKSWMGPVPFTKPLRTLVDCIEKGLTPDLMLQGIEDARRRGKISAAEAERLRLANLKSA